MFLYKDILTGLILRKLIFDPLAIVAMGQLNKTARLWTMSCKATRLASFALLSTLPKYTANKIRKKRHSAWHVLIAFHKAKLRQSHMYALEDEAARDASLLLKHTQLLVFPQNRCSKVLVMCEYVPPSQNTRCMLRFVLGCGDEEKVRLFLGYRFISIFKI